MTLTTPTGPNVTDAALIARGAIALIPQQAKTVAGVARKLGFDRTLIYHWRAGSRAMTRDHADRLARELGTSLDYLTFLGQRDRDKQEGSAP